MDKFASTGRCPRCDVVLVAGIHVDALKSALRTFDARFSGGITARRRDRVGLPGISPLKVSWLPGSTGMKCISCSGTWSLSSGSGVLLLNLNSALAQEGMLIGQEAEPQPAAPRARRVSLQNCGLMGTRSERRIEVPLEAEIAPLRNSSTTATVTHEVSIVQEIRQTVTLEDSQLKSSQTGAGVTLWGFADIRGAVQSQIAKKHSITTQSTISISRRTTVEMPPNSHLEGTIQWIAVYTEGIAAIGRINNATPLELAQVPYKFPVGLKYTFDVRDV